MPHHLADASYKSHQWVDSARVQKEVGCAFAASFLVSPLVSIIDKAIVQEISGIGSLMASMGGACKEMVMKPKAFLTGLPFRLTFAVYFGTYAVANLSEAALDHYKIEDDSVRKTNKVGASAVANVGLLAWRDSVFARVYSSGDAAKKKTPFRTVGLFAVRDTVTMAATFYAAPRASEYLISKHGWNKEKAEISTALAVPVVAQFLTAPVHIHALDYFSRQQATTAERWAKINEEMGKVCFARGLRILPAFGIGSYSNNKFRELFIKQKGDMEMPFTREVRRRASFYTGEENKEKVMANSPSQS